MTIRLRLILSFLTIFFIFGVNLFIYFLSNQTRQKALDDLTSALIHQAQLAPIQQKFNDLQKQTALISQNSTPLPLSANERDNLIAQLTLIREQIEDFRRGADSDLTVSLELFANDYVRLGSTWRFFYENFGINHAEAILKLATEAEPLSLRLREQLAKMLEAQRRRQKRASMHFQGVTRWTNRFLVLFFGLSAFLAIALAWRFSRYLTRRLDELKRGTAFLGGGLLSHRIPKEASDELGDLASAFNEMAEKLSVSRKELTEANQELDAHRAHLEEKILTRTKELSCLNEKLTDQTSQLMAVNRKLEAFTYSASHDLRSPLTHIRHTVDFLLEDYGEKLGGTGKQYLDRLVGSADRMVRLIDDLMWLSRVGKMEMRREIVNLSSIAEALVREFKEKEPARNVECVIARDRVADVDKGLIQILLANLLENAWKYTGPRPLAKIEFGMTQEGNKEVFFVRDNGVGFDMKYKRRLFEPFQRLHSAREFAGTGIGLATVAEIIERHGGQIWAEAAVDQGAAFYFTLCPSTQLHIRPE